MISYEDINPASRKSCIVVQLYSKGFSFDTSP
jgi:hypothetical protein